MADTVIRLSKPQRDIFMSPKRFKIVNAGRRFGKSYCVGTIAMDKVCNNKKKVVIYVAPTLVMARNVMWKWIKEHIPQEYIENKNEQLMTIEFLTGSVFYCMSAQDPDRLRGLAADLLIVDECADISNDFYDIVLPVLADKYHDGEAIYISTPKGYNWFYDRYCDAMEDPENWDYFQYTTYDGGNVTEEEIEIMKKTMSPKMVRQELFASFEDVSGRVYENFDKVKSLCDFDESWGKADIHVGMDFNVNPMTAVISVNERGTTYIFDEIVEPNSNTQEMATLIKNKYPEATVFVYPDPTGNKRQTNAVTGQTDFDILRKNGFIVCAPKHPYATKDKFNTVNAALLNGNDVRKVYIARDRCLKLQKAWNGYVYKDNGDTDKSSGLDHISDAAAYLICYKHPFRGFNKIRRPNVTGI